jgi:RNA polymerase sigma-70 factor (ECF subfamily)
VLAAAIEALPEEYRAVLLLHDVDGLSSPEISEALQIKLGTIKSRAHRARLFLRSRLADYMERAPEPPEEMPLHRGPRRPSRRQWRLGAGSRDRARAIP